MSKVIVLGGYGGFGARLSRRLAADGWQVIVAGRNLHAARRLAAQIPDARPMKMDRDGDIAGVLADLQPLLLVDAAGPFQGSGRHVPAACIASGVNYIDLADATDFVRGIGELNEAARKAGVAVVSGASSVPALSGAAIRDLATGMDDLRSIEMSISASNRATAGQSVASAILGTVGKRLRLWRHRKWNDAIGWRMLRRERYEVTGEPPMSRLVALADVPDNAIWPETMPGRPATLFRAGPELGFQTIALWLLSWPVSWNWIGPLAGWSRWLLPLQGLTAWLGSDRSAMKVEVKGGSGDRFSVRTWTLIANKGDGPEIPTLAAQLLARKLRNGGLEPGAHHAGAALALAEFRSLFAELAIVEETRDRSYVPLYARVMGNRFDALPGVVRAMHQVIGNSGASGTATVTRGRSLTARAVAWLMGFPPEGDHAVHVSFTENDGTENWTRDFGGHQFSSELSERGGRLTERFGPLRFRFDLPSNHCGLEMRMAGWSAFGIPLPLTFAPRSVAREWAEGDDFCFDVPIALPMVGNVVHYRGKLRRV